MNPESPFGAPQQPLQPVQPNQQVQPSFQGQPGAFPGQPNGAGQPPMPQQAPQNAPSGYPLTQPPKVKNKLPLGLIIGLVVSILLLIGACVWAYMLFQEKEDYKNNVEQKVSAAVVSAKEETEKVKEAEFLEREKSPYKVYNGPATFGSLKITYPKSWAAAVTETDRGGTLVDGYFHPGFVPGADSGTAFALRAEVIEQPYDRLLKQYDANAKRGTVKVSAYKAPKVPAVLGSRIDGEIERGLNGSVILLPLRDKTIKLSVDSQTFIKDFNNIILPNFVFVP